MTSIDIAINVCGWIGNITIVLINIPQLIKSLRTRSTQDISLWSQLLFGFVSINLTIYGTLLQQYPILVGNSISFLIVIPIIILKLTEYKRIKKDDTDICR